MSSNIFFISDLHFRHNRILEFSGSYRDGSTTQEHDQILIDKWNSVVTKRDVVYVLGDVFFGAKQEGLSLVSQLKGTKHLILGNHDRNARDYIEHFQRIQGLFKYKGYWLSHAPLHPYELRDCKNIHGHLHHMAVRKLLGAIDENYINVCVEHTNGFPVNFEDIVTGTYKTRSIG